MRAVDTNILVRFLTADDAAQYRRARKVMEAGEVFVPKTVLLETEWVLRHAYDLAPADILSAFMALANAAEVELEDADAVARALALFQAGMDFADALHIASKGSATGFVTFDKRLLMSARKAGVKNVVQPDK